MMGAVMMTQTHSPMFRTALLLAPLAMALTVAAQEPAGLWTEDHPAALKQAKAEKKDVLLDFTGSDWCIWCQKLHKEVFDTEAFKKAAPGHFVLVELDFPNKAKQADELKKQNADLKKKFSVRGFPTIFLTDAEGRVYAQTGYKPGGAEKYLESLEQCRQHRIARDEKWAAAAKASGGERARLLAEGLQALQNNEVALKHYTTEIAEIAQLDADGKAGGKDICDKMKAEVAAEAKYNETLNGILKNVRTDAAGTMEKLCSLAEDKTLTLAQRQQSMGIAGKVAVRESKDNAKARELFAKAIAMDPKSEIAEDLKSELGKIKVAEQK
jgi:thioredoxin-related protein